MASSTATATARTLAKARYISLTTFRKDGRGVPTPVWFAEEGGNLYVYTSMNTGKAKRIRATGKVTVAACDHRGKVTSPAYDANARLLPASDGPRIDALLNKKYGLQKRLVNLTMRVARLVRRGPSGEDAYIEITLTEK